MPYSADRLSYQLEDNNSTLVILLDGKTTFTSIEIHHDEQDGYFRGESFTERDKDTYGEDTLNALVEHALLSLNAELTKHTPTAPTAQQIGAFMKSKGGGHRTPRAVAGRLLEEMVELALSCGLSTGDIFSHVTDALYNQSLKLSVQTKHTVFPSELTEPYTNAPSELADVGIHLKDLAYVLNVDQTKAESEKWADFIQRDFKVSKGGTLYAKKPHIKN